MKKRWSMAVLAAVFLAVQAAPVNAAAEQTAQTETTDSSRETSALSDDEISRLLDFVKEKWDAGNFESQADILAAIEEGEEKYSVVLKDSQREQLAAAVKRLDDLGMDHAVAIGMAKKLYQEHGDEIGNSLKEQLAEPLEKAIQEQLAEPLEKAIQEQVVEPAKEAAKEVVVNTAKTFWSDLKNSVVSFFRNIFS